MQTLSGLIDNVLTVAGRRPPTDPAALQRELDTIETDLEGAEDAFARAVLAEIEGTSQDAATTRAKAEMSRDRLATRREALQAALQAAQARERESLQDEAAKAEQEVLKAARTANAARQATAARLASRLHDLATAYQEHILATRSLVAALPTPPRDVDGSLLKAGAIESLMLLELARHGCVLGAERVSPSILRDLPNFSERLDEAGKVVSQWLSPKGAEQ